MQQHTKEIEFGDLGAKNTKMKFVHTVGVFFIVRWMFGDDALVGFEHNVNKMFGNKGCRKQKPQAHEMDLVDPWT